MILSYDIAVDLTPEFNRQLSPKFSVSLGDHGAREYTVKILQGGEPYEIEEGSTVSIVGKKQDGHIFAYACTYADEYVYFTIEEQMTPVSGIVTCELSIIDASGNKVGSANFTYWVEPSPVTDGEASESDLQLFQQAVDAAGDVQRILDSFGGPNVARTADEMINTSKVYVYIGNETGYTYGHWYYHDPQDNTWKSGGIYQSSGVDVDTTLSVVGVAADAKATGDEITELKDSFDVAIASNSNYRHTDTPVYQTITGWELKGDGASSQASDFILRKYKVTAGDLIYLKISKDGSGTFQFQSGTNVPSNVPNPYLVGTAYTSAIDGYMTVPSGATYLIVSQLADNVSNVIQSITYDYDMDTNFMFMMGNPSFTNKIFVVNGSTITIQSRPRLFLYYKGKTYAFPGDATQEYTLTNGKTLVFDTDALISGGINVSSISQIFYLVDYAAYSDKCIPVCNYRKDSYTDRLFWSPLFAQYYYENLTDESQTNQQIDNRLLETYLIGHGRDYYTAPENTLPLWELQRSRGLNVLEGDVAVTSDGVPVLLHDTTIDRTSDGTGNIADMTYTQASQYNYNSDLSSYGNIALPTLAEFLSYAHKYNMCVELDMAGHTYTEANIKTIITTVIEKGMLTRTIFTMSASDAYRKVLSVDPRCIVMATNITTIANIDTALSCKAKFVSIPFASLTSALCDYAHSKGMLVKTWTIDTASDCLHAFETGADCVDVDKISNNDVFGI